MFLCHFEKHGLSGRNRLMPEYGSLGEDQQAEWGRLGALPLYECPYEKKKCERPFHVFTVDFE